MGVTVIAVVLIIVGWALWRYVPSRPYEVAKEKSREEREGERQYGQNQDERLEVIQNRAIEALEEELAGREDERKRWLRSGIDDIDTLSGVEFEERMRLHFETKGYHVELTPASNDYGADLVMVDSSGQKTVAQLKRHASSVGVKAVQEIATAKNFYKADQALVITNSYFTKNAVLLANNTNVELWDRESLVEELSNVAPVELDAIESESHWIDDHAFRQELDSICSQAINKQETLGHILVIGTNFKDERELASWIAWRLNASIQVVSPYEIERPGDLAALVVNFQPGDVLFIHTPEFSPETEEMITMAMRNFSLDIQIGRGPYAQKVHLALPPFTLICSYHERLQRPLSATVMDCFEYTIRMGREDISLRTRTSPEQELRNREEY